MFRIACLALAAGLLATSAASAQVIRRPTRTAPVQSVPVTTPVAAPTAAPVVTTAGVPVVTTAEVPLAMPAPTPAVSSPVQYQLVPTPPSTSYPCAQPCPCGPTTNGPCGYCNHPPELIHRPEKCPTIVTCTPIQYELTPPDPTNCKNVPFYKHCVNFEHVIPVPTIKEECREYLKFQEVTISLICCDVKVCVPCERCWEKTKKCEWENRKTAIEACIRQDGTIDVYALNVPGLPKKYVLGLMISVEKFKKDYPGQTLP